MTNLNISISSTALFSTWVYVDNFGLLFDAGDGVSASLGQRVRRVKHVFITHSDRDHVCGLLQLHQLAAQNGTPSIYYPRDSGSLPALRDFMERFDPQSGPATWIGLHHREIVPVGKTHYVLGCKSEHIVEEGKVKALDYTLCLQRRTLRPELEGMEGKDLGKLRKSMGEDAVTEVKIDRLLGFSGDAPRLDPEHWKGVKVLIHEATFLQPDTGRGRHSNLVEVLRAAAQLDLEALILTHFSVRYTHDEILTAIKKLAAENDLKFPVYAIMPGEVCDNVLHGRKFPVWNPSWSGDDA